MSPIAHSIHSRPQDQVLVHIAPNQRPRPTSFIPSSSFPSVNPAKSVQEHNAATTKHDDHDNKTHMLQLYHIDSDPNISSSKHPAYQTPSFKDATMIDMTEYPLDKNEDRNEDKEGDVMEFNNSGNEQAHYGQHHPLKTQQQQLFSDEADSRSHNEGDASFREQSGQQDDSSSLQEQAMDQDERDSVSLHSQQQSDGLCPHEIAAQSESTPRDKVQENQLEEASTTDAHHTKTHTITSAPVLTDPSSATAATSHSQDGVSTSALTASPAAAAAAAVSIVVTGVDDRPQTQQRPQQPHSSSLFDFFRGRKTSIPKSSSLPHHHPSVTKGSSSSGSAIPAIPSAASVKAPLTGTPPPISKSRMFSSATKTSLDSGYHRRGSTSSSTTNTNTSIHYSSTKPGSQINKRETIGSLPMPMRIDRSIGAHSNRTSYASSNSTSSVFAHSNNSGSNGSSGSSSSFAAPADTVPLEDVSATAKTGTSASRQISSVAATIPASTTTTTSSSSMVSSQSIASSAHSTLTKVAAAVVGATVGKRRPTVTSGFSSSETDSGPMSTRLGPGGGVAGGTGGGAGVLKSFQQPPPSLQRPRQQQPMTIVHGLESKNNVMNEENSRQRLVGLDQERLGQHATFMKVERSVPELREYISQLYKTILGKDEALEHSQKQIASLRSELDRVRSYAEEEKKELVDEMDRTKEQIVTMEENFLLWRTKVHNDQATLQDNLLNERLDKQDRIDELEEDLNASQEEADRLRSRLLVLEYEEGYHGPSSFLPDDNTSDMSSSSSSSGSSHTGSNSSNRGSSVSIVIEHGPMTVDTHRRRSADFTLLEQRAQSFEALVQDLRRTLELERQQHQRELKSIRMQSQARLDKLEHDIQAAKMEATMYAEMMHEVVTENDDLRGRVKSASRVMRRHGWTDPNKKKSDDSGGGQNSSVVVSASTSRSNSQGSASGHRSRPRNSDNFGFPSGMDSESDDGSDEDMEEIAI